MLHSIILYENVLSNRSCKSRESDLPVSPLENTKSQTTQKMVRKSTLLALYFFALVSARASVEENLFLPVDLAPLTGHDGAGEQATVEGIPFLIQDGGALSLADAGWPEWKKDPGAFYEKYDADNAKEPAEGDHKVYLFQAPRADYSAAHILASAEEGAGNAVTLRAGRRVWGAGVNSQVTFTDFFGKVPRGGKDSPRVVRIPLDTAFAQDIEGDVMDIEVTKELRLARRSPDPCRFRWRPLGLPSGVRIVGLTLERSPLQFALEADAAGSLFEAPERPGFKARLTNITGEPQDWTLDILVDGKSVETLRGRVPAGETVTQAIDLPEQPLGHHRMEVVVSNAAGRLFSRRVAFGCLPKDERVHRDEGPVGTWTFNGTHFTPRDETPEMAALFRKLGLRYGMFGASEKFRKQAGVLRGNEYTVRKIGSGEQSLEDYEKRLEQQPDTPPTILLFHEDSISGPHVTRIPDLFHDRPPYKLDAKEKERFEAMFQTAADAVKAIRAKYPHVKFALGNGPLPLREEFYRHKFPRELFDFAGNEAGVFGRPPETQPPDIIANNASLWMDRQMLDAYGYPEKSIRQCYEVIYPGTNPGNLSLDTQADYFVRHILHSMAWGMPQIRVGGLTDSGNSYYFSNWGATGFFTSRPRIEPKPAALAIATLTRVLDGAKYDGNLETGSESAYLLRFQKKDGSLALPYWVVRGRRDFHVRLGAGASASVSVVSRDGASREVAVTDGIVTLQATASPEYLLLPAGVKIQDVTLGTPVHEAQPAGAITELDPLANLEGWKIADKRNPELEVYNPLTPRRLGDFHFESVKDPEGASLRVTPRPIKEGKATMPMYAELLRPGGIPLPGEPTEVGLWVNGNSGWGRIIFELEDASGQRWTSIGAKTEGDSRWMEDWLPKEMLEDFKPGEMADWNTDDVFGLSRINFDGWRYVGFPLPGQYPGEGYHWPANSQWKSTGDGIVHYPLRLTKLIVEMPEKTLKLDRFEPAKHPEIHLRRLIAAENPEINTPKTTSDDYVESSQVNMQ